MNLVFEISDDNTLIGFTKDDALAESMVVEKFRDVALEGDELVRVEFNGLPTYTIRKKAEQVVDEFEYEDNEGNAITADGSEIIESDELVEQEPEYEYHGDYAWVISVGEEDKTLSALSAEFYFMFHSSQSPFEENENLVIIATV